MVALLWQGLRWRRTASSAVLAAAVVACAAAALGPLYARSAEDSLVRQRVGQAPAVEVGLTVTAALSGPRRFAEDDASSYQPPPAVADAVRDTALDPGLDRWFGPVSTSLTFPEAAVRLSGSTLGIATVSWRDRACEGLRLATGRCPRAAGDALVSLRTAETYALRAGSPLQLDLTGAGGPLTVRVAGVYADITARDAVWGAESPIQWAEPREPDGPRRLDMVLVSRADVGGPTLRGTAAAYRPLRRDRISLSTLPAVVADVDAARAGVAAAGRDREGRPGAMPEFVLRNDVGGLARAVGGQRSDLRTAAYTVTAQLLALAWFVLYLVVVTTTEERSGEVALAKLRGLSPGRTAVLTLAEVWLLLVLAAPAGLLLALGADGLLARGLLAPRTDAVVERGTWAALAVAILGGLVATALATRRLLTAPVLDQLRRTAGTRGARLRSVAVDAVAVALAVEGVYLLKTGGADRVALFTPALLALAGGLLAVRLVPLAALAGVRRSRGRPGIAGFLAVRNLARRPGTGRVVVLVAVAVALAVFGVQEWLIAREARSDLARTQVPAARVVHVADAAPGALRAAVRAADRDGRWAMAAVRLSGTLAVDSPRLAAVTAWDPAWVGTSAAALAAGLHPASEKPLAVRDTLAVTATTAMPDARVRDTRVEALLTDPQGDDRRATLGPLRSGRATYRAELPGCRPACRLQRLSLVVDPFAASPPFGDVVLTAVADATGPVDAGFAEKGRWRQARTADLLLDPSAERLGDVTATRGGLVVSLRGDNDPAVEVADHPRDVPALLGDRAAYSSFDDTPGLWRLAGLDADQFVAESLPRRGLLPLVGRTGALVDLGSTTDVAVQRRWSAADAQVWLSPAAPPDAAERLTDAGLAVAGVDVLADRRAVLDRDGTSLALALYVVAALAAILVAGGAVLATTYLGSRRRAYELAAARLLGARRGRLVAAGRVEQLVLVVTGVAVGTATGGYATSLVLDALPAVTGGRDAVREYGVRWPSLWLVAGAAVVVAVLFAEVGARRVVAAADTGLLQQAQQ